MFTGVQHSRLAQPSTVPDGVAEQLGEHQVHVLVQFTPWWPSEDFRQCAPGPVAAFSAGDGVMWVWWSPSGGALIPEIRRRGLGSDGRNAGSVERLGGR